MADRRIRSTRNNNFLMWPVNVLTVLSYLFAAIPALKVSNHFYGAKHVFIYKSL